MNAYYYLTDDEFTHDQDSCRREDFESLEELIEMSSNKIFEMCGTLINKIEHAGHSHERIDRTLK